MKSTDHTGTDIFRRGIRLSTAGNAPGALPGLLLLLLALTGSIPAGAIPSAALPPDPASVGSIPDAAALNPPAVPAVEPPPPEVRASSAVVLDFETGTVLYEKAADIPIPPASLTKLVTMYITCSLVEEGRLSWDESVSISRNAWAATMPGSSLMFLEPGQRVTVRELLLGLSVVSGNDAAVALAEHIAGSVPAFVDMMNRTTHDLGLPSLRFVDSSGLDGASIVTAREFAEFARIYIRRFPENLEQFHSILELSYPLDRNMPVDRISGTRTITQFNRNLLLSEDGSDIRVDGLKTGFVYESGYNFALTAIKEGMRVVVVTLGGPGRNHIEGNRIRVADGTALLEYSFATWTNVSPPVPKLPGVRVWKGSAREIRPVPIGPGVFTVRRTAAGMLVPEVRLPEAVLAPIPPGARLGEIVYTAGGLEVIRIPLTAERGIPEGSSFRRFWDGIALWFRSLLGKEPPALAA